MSPGRVNVHSVMPTDHVMTDLPIPPPPVGPTITDLTLLAGWAATVLMFDGHPIPVLSLQSHDGWRHYAWPKEQIAHLKKWLNAAETETALAVGVRSVS
jgi:hypothetical protein